MEHERATVESTRLELEDLKKRLASRLLEIEEYSDQLQLAATDISELEARNTELEEGLANRSTESEAQHKSEEIFQLKEDLEDLRIRYFTKETELLSSIEEINLAKSKISELEAVLSAARLAAESDPSRPGEYSTQANLLHAKIERLRIERDELRQTLSFSKHEHRFAIQAAEADRISAMEELSQTRLELKKKEIDTSKLQSELDNHREQLHTLSTELDEVRGRMAVLSTEKNDELDQQISQLQSELEVTKADREQMRESSIGFFSRHGELQREHDLAIERYKGLSEHFQALQGQYSDVSRRVVEVEKARNVALKERDDCLEKMDNMRPVDVNVLGNSVNSASGSGELGGSTAIIEGRIRRELRRASLMAFQDHAALEQVKKLELVEGRLTVEKENLMAERERVKRREGESCVLVSCCIEVADGFSCHY